MKTHTFAEYEEALKTFAKSIHGKFAKGRMVLHHGRGSLGGARMSITKGNATIKFFVHRSSRGTSRNDAAVSAFQETVKGEGRTNWMSIGYTASNPRKTVTLSRRFFKDMK